MLKVWKDYKQKSNELYKVQLFLIECFYSYMQFYMNYVYMLMWQHIH